MRLNLFKRSEAKAPLIDGVARIRIDEKRLSAANVDALKEKLLPLIANKKNAVLECDQLTFIDSSGLGFLVSLRNSMIAPKKVVLEGISDPTLIELIKLTRMDQVFLLSASQNETSVLLKAS